MTRVLWLSCQSFQWLSGRALSPVTTTTNTMKNGCMQFRSGNDISSFQRMYPFCFNKEVLWVLMYLTQNYASNMSSTLLLDALHVAVWSHIWFESYQSDPCTDIQDSDRWVGRLLSPIPLLKRRLPPINIMGNGTLDSQLHSTLAGTQGKTKHLIVGAMVPCLEPISKRIKNQKLHTLCTINYVI